MKLTPSLPFLAMGFLIACTPISRKVEFARTETTGTQAIFQTTLDPMNTAWVIEVEVGTAEHETNQCRLTLVNLGTTPLQWTISKSLKATGEPHPDVGPGQRVTFFEGILADLTHGGWSPLYLQPRSKSAIAIVLEAKPGYQLPNPVKVIAYFSHGP